jgi:hypothetical protein
MDYGESLDYIDPELADWVAEAGDEYTGILLRPEDDRRDALEQLDDHGIQAEPVATESVSAYVQSDDVAWMVEDGVVAAVEFVRPITFYDTADDLPELQNTYDR